MDNLKKILKGIAIRPLPAALGFVAYLIRGEQGFMVVQLFVAGLCFPETKQVALEDMQCEIKAK